MSTVKLDNSKLLDSKHSVVSKLFYDHFNNLLHIATTIRVTNFALTKKFTKTKFDCILGMKI